MRKRLISEYAAVLLLFGCLVFLIGRFFWIAAVFWVLWYLLYGFVGLAFSFTSRKKTGASNIFLRITVVPFLLPFRKAFYYWTKSANVTAKNPKDTQKAFELAQKVNVQALYTDNNKTMFYVYYAALSFDMGDGDTALVYIQKAKDLPHREALDEGIDRLFDIITKP